MKTSEILLKAADEIETRGHAHEFYMDNSGGVCAVGALRLACGGEVKSGFSDAVQFSVETDSAGDAHVRDARRALENYLNLDTTLLSVVEWNDSNDKDTVITAMREAAKVEASNGR